MEFEKWFQRVELKFRELHGEQSISDSFLQFMQSSLKAYFKSRFGFDPAKMNGKVMISSITKPFAPSEGENVIHFLLAIHHFGMEVSFYWKSREGYKTILPSDPDFNAARLETRIEGVDPVQVREYLGVKPELQRYFSEVDTHFPLEVDQFNADLVYLVIKGENGSRLEEVGRSLDGFVRRWNQSQESGHPGPDQGRFHSSGIERVESNTLYYKIDLGTTNENGLKHLLEALNHHKIDTVRITSFP